MDAGRAMGAHRHQPMRQGHTDTRLRRPRQIAQHAGPLERQALGIYFQVNPDRRNPAGIRSKAAKTDIAEARWLHCDLDTYKDGQDAMAKLQHVAPAPPTVVTSSGHGVQAFWRLRQPVGPRTDIESVEDRNRWLARELGGDSTFDVCRIVRLPGCINWPNQRKQAMGLGPALAKLISWNDTLAYGLVDRI